MAKQFCRRGFMGMSGAALAGPPDLPLDAGDGHQP